MLQITDSTALISAVSAVRCKDFWLWGHLAKLVKTEDIPKVNPESIKSATATLSSSDL